MKKTGGKASSKHTIIYIQTIQINTIFAGIMGPITNTKQQETIIQDTRYKYTLYTLYKYRTIALIKLRAA